MALGERIVGGLRGRAVKAAQASTGIRAVWNVALAIALALGLEFFLGVGARTASFVNRTMEVKEEVSRNTGASWGLFRAGEQVRVVPYDEGGRRIGCVPGDSNCYLELSFVHGWLGVRGLSLLVIALVLFLVSALAVQRLLGPPAVLQGKSFTLTHRFFDTAEGGDGCEVTRVYEGLTTHARRFTLPVTLHYDERNEGEGEPQPRLLPGSLRLTPLDDASRRANLRFSPPHPGVASYGGEVIADDASAPFSFKIEYTVLDIFPRDAAVARRRSGGRRSGDGTEWEPKAFWDEVQVNFANPGSGRAELQAFTRVAGSDDARELREGGFKPHAWTLSLRNVRQDIYLVFRWRLREPPAGALDADQRLGS